MRSLRPLHTSMHARGRSQADTKDQWLRIAIAVTIFLILRDALDYAVQARPWDGARERLHTAWASWHDPEVGSPVSLAGLVTISPHPDLKTNHNFRATLVCVASTCTTCMDNTYIGGMEDLQKTHKDLRCRLVAAHREEVEDLAAAPRPLIALDWDAGGRFAKRVNAFFLPRVYLLDATRRIVYVQPSGQAPDKAFLAVSRLLQRLTATADRNQEKPESAIRIGVDRVRIGTNRRSGPGA